VSIVFILGRCLYSLGTDVLVAKCDAVFDSEKPRGKDKESDSVKQTKDRSKRLTDKSNVEQQKQKTTDGRYFC